MVFYQFQGEQFINTSIENIWDFISYTVRPLFGILTNWVTEITHIRDKSYFVDEQRVGPYKLWHHQHIILPEKSGVLMKDIVSYRPPLCWLGSMTNALLIKNKLNEIFDYRAEVLKKIYPL